MSCQVKTLIFFIDARSAKIGPVIPEIFGVEATKIIRDLAKST